MVILLIANDIMRLMNSFMICRCIGIDGKSNRQMSGLTVPKQS